MAMTIRIVNFLMNPEFYGSDEPSNCLTYTEQSSCCLGSHVDEQGNSNGLVGHTFQSTVVTDVYDNKRDASF